MKKQVENEHKKLCLPYEVWIQIISSLQLPSICLMRCVSKTWYNMITDLFKANPEDVKPLLTNIVILGNKCGPSRNLFMAEFHVTRDDPGVVTVTNPDVYDLGCEYLPVASCNGLVLLIASYDVNPFSYCISNPIIGEYMKLPFPKDIEQKRHFCGFGFCPSTKQYKVIQFRYDILWEITVVEIHTLGAYTWRDTQIVPPVLLNHQVFWDHGIIGTYLNGALYWRVVGMVYRFDLETEQFSSIVAPGYEVLRYKDLTFLGATRRNLYASVHSPGALDVFLLRSSWTKEFSVSVPHMDKRFDKCDIEVINYGDGTNIIILGSRDIVSLDFYLMATYLKADVENVASVEKIRSRYHPVAYSPNFTSLSEVVPGQSYQIRFKRSISPEIDSQTNQS